MSNTRKQIFMPFLYALLVALGVFIGRNFIKSPGPGSSNPLMIYPQANNKLDGIITLIEDEYVDTIDRLSIEERIIPEILKDLDPHSVYIPAKDLNKVNEELQGNFGGIGVQFSMQNDTVMVIQVIQGGPSEKVGILPGDRIVAVDDSIIAGKNIATNDVMKKLRGEMGTDVKVGVLRRPNKDLIDFNITRGSIPIYSVEVSYMVNETTGYIKVDKFAQNTYQEFLTALAKLKANNCQEVIIDFRGNSGGLLDVAIRLCNEFLPAKDLIVYTEGKAQKRQNVHANGAGTCQDTKVIVLIDEFSASASEIFAGAIQDNDRGLVIGRRSFGKGLVQQQIPLSDGSALRLTVARYHTPSGRFIQKPYDNGNEDYYEDIYKRYEHGEFFNQDSIEFDDELKYTTKNGRTVYGGGGIMPDIFIPRDTSMITDYFYKLRMNGIIYRYALQYTDNHRAKLEAYTNAEALEKYLDKQALLSDFLRFAKDKGVEYSSKEYQTSKQLIEIELKAYIARNMIDNEGFYPILHRVDDIFQKAVEEAGKLES
ncbi:PDZ domain-containing protein [Carboxylicivirga sp. A043]|uniref:S41 family peptidase n=1 Tax=Carboxylicivirga litoralis TaxID=2816963 RepID=UPI0021CB7887|nr:S41 family peptidase [Carboxylicivirga sp. A043]MCU4155935.1 PDZ domain-containing protein [Carboxylicivirga sp. A043]